MKIIKKYENRCLYDAETSTNVTIADLKKFVIDFIPFKIINAKTEEDLTRSYLIQIILELEAMDSPLFTENSLAGIIRLYGDPMQKKMQEYLEQTLKIMAQWQAMWVDTLKSKT